MSFFIKVKRGKKSLDEDNSKKRKKSKSDEISSESEEEHDDEAVIESENETETAQEKRLRLAKAYLKEIENEEKERLAGDDPDVSSRLQEDYLRQTGRFRSTVADKYIGVNTDSLEVIMNRDQKKPITCVCVSFDNRYIFAGSKDGSIVKWCVETRKKVGCLPFLKIPEVKNKTGHSKPITCIAVSDNFKYLAVADESPIIEVWSPDTLENLGNLRSHRKDVTGVVFRKNASDLYSCGKDGSVKIWNLDGMAYLETLFGHQDCIMAIDGLSRERAVTAGGMDSSLRLWKIPEESQLIYNGTGSIDCVKLINEDHFVSGGNNGELCIWGIMRKKPLCTVQNAHGMDKNNSPNWIISVAALINTDLIASGSCDGQIRLWKLSDSYKTISPLFQVKARGFVNSLQFTSDGKYLIAGMGREHRCGRWTVIRQSRNGVMIIPLLKSE